MQKKSSFLSFCSFLVKFREKHRGSCRVKMRKCDKVEWGKNAIMTCLLNGPIFNLLFYCHIVLYREKQS